MDFAGYKSVANFEDWTLLIVLSCVFVIKSCIHFLDFVFIMKKVYFLCFVTFLIQSSDDVNVSESFN